MATEPTGHIRRRGKQYEAAVCRGRDSSTGRYRYVYAYGATYADAVRERERLLAQVAAGVHEGAEVTVGALLDRRPVGAHPAAAEFGEDGVDLDAVVRRALGEMRLRTLQDRVDALDLLYAHLRRCDQLCDGRPRTDQRTSDRHTCVHECRPMPRPEVRQLHRLLLAAFDVAISWGWMDRNPAERATPPRARP